MNTTVAGLIAVLFLSTIVGWFLSQRKQVEKPVKVMLFVLYFWMCVFIQLIVFAILYQLGLLDSLPNNLW